MIFYLEKMFLNLFIK